MFTQLNALRGKVARIGLSVMFVESERMQVLVTPVPTDEAQKQAPGLATPFVLTGTPEELDANFAQQFGSLATAYGTFADQVNAQIKAIEDAAAQAKADAEKKRQETAAKQVPRKGSTVTRTELANALTGGKSDSGTDDDNDDDDTPETTSVAVQPNAAPTEPAVMSADQLF